MWRDAVADAEVFETCSGHEAREPRPELAQIPRADVHRESTQAADGAYRARGAGSMREVMRLKGGELWKHGQDLEDVGARGIPQGEACQTTQTREYC